LLAVLLLHLIFFLVVAPLLKLEAETPDRTEVTQISQQQLEQLKKQMRKDKYLPPLLKQELHEEYKTKEPPKDAHMMGQFNQTVPREKVAGPQADQPLEGGGGGSGKGGKPHAKSEQRPPLNLSQLGLGNKVPKPIPQEESSPAGPQGPPAPHRPVGRDDKNLEHGDENLLNAVESKYYSFFARLEEPIIRNWFFLLRSNDRQIQGEMISHGIREGAELPVTIEMVLDRQGNFHAVNVIQSSRLPTLDRVTAEAVRKLGSLPNPPPELFEGQPYFTRTLRFMVHVTSSPTINTRPDLTW
jgi:TonB family protein